VNKESMLTKCQHHCTT